MAEDTPNTKNPLERSIHTLPSTTRDWHRRVWVLAGPIILSNLTVPLVGAVDTAVVGHLPDAVYMGAVALGAIVFNFLYWGFGFLRMGTSGFIAQAYGAGDASEVRVALARALLIAVVIGIFVIAMQIPISKLAFSVLEGSRQLEGLAQSYFAVRIWSAPAALVNFAILGCLVGIHNTRAALGVQLTLNLCNVVLDLLFVLGFGWGVEGVGLASLISEYIAVFVGLWIIKLNFDCLGGSWKPHTIFDSRSLKALIHVNANIFIRTLGVIFAFFYFTAMSTKLGEVTLAANAVLMHMQHFLAFGLDGFAFAVEALAGSAYGMRSRSQFRAAIKATTLWALIFAGIYTIIYACFGIHIINAITGIENVRLRAAEFLPWLIVSPLISVWSYQLDGIFIASTRSVEMRNGMLLAVSSFLVAVRLFVPRWENHGLWLSLIILMIGRAVFLAIYYPRIEKNLD